MIFILFTVFSFILYLTQFIFALLASEYGTKKIPLYNYTDTDMSNAIAAVRKGMSLGKAGKQPVLRKRANPLLAAIPASLVDSLIIPSSPEKKQNNVRTMIKARVFIGVEHRELFRKNIEKKKKGEEEVKKKRKEEKEKKTAEKAKTKETKKKNKKSLGGNDEERGEDTRVEIRPIRRRTVPKRFKLSAESYFCKNCKK